MPTVNCPSETTLRQYIAQDLGDDDARALTEHLDQCRTCHDTASRLSETDSLPADTWDAPTSPPGPDVAGRADLELSTVYRSAHPGAGASPVNDAAWLPPRYQPIGQVARGGMGQVIRVRDSNLMRDLAVKMLLPKFRDEPSAVERFEREATLTGMLQHPGVPPVVELGNCNDGTPFFAMKLIEGQTLEDLLRHRSGAEDQRATFLGYFLQVAQTVAYAHSQHIIHRDLKPLNIMVGEFGEVQVMDWGLAKSLSDTAGDHPREHGDDLILPQQEETSHGTVLGTLAYMPPEQARGDVGRIDERSDVFGLGAILCAILTGQPPYVASDFQALATMAQGADLRSTFARLDQHAGEAELSALAKRCLDPDPNARFANASLLADAVERHLLAAEERARLAELEIATQRASADAEARRRRTQRALFEVIAATVVIAICIGGWFFMRENIRQQIRNEQLEEVTTEAAMLYEQLAGDPTTQSAAWLQVQDRLARARAIVANGPVSADLESRVDRLSQDLGAAENDRRILVALEEAYHRPTQDFDATTDTWNLVTTYQLYHSAFDNYGIHAEMTPVDEAAALLESRDPKIRREIVAALGDWLLIATSRGSASTVQWIRQLNVRMSDDPWQSKLWHAVADNDGQTLVQLARATATSEQHPKAISVLARALQWKQPGTGHVVRELLTDYFQRAPDDFWINVTLGQCFMRETPRRPERAIQFFFTALAIRRDSAVREDLARALLEEGRFVEAESQAMLVLELDGDNLDAQGLRATAAAQRGDFARSLDIVSRAIKRHPHDKWHYATLAATVAKHEPLGDWVALFRTQLPEEADTVSAETALGVFLNEMGRTDDARAVLEALVASRPEVADPYAALGKLYQDEGESEHARQMLQRATEIQPAVKHLIALGQFYSGEKAWKQAIVHLTRALEMDPRQDQAMRSLVEPLFYDNQIERAEDLLANLKERYVEDVWIYEWQGVICLQRGDVDEAIALSERAIAIDPQHVVPYRTLVDALERQERWNEASAAMIEFYGVDPVLLDRSPAAAAQTILRADPLSERAGQIARSLLQAKLRWWQALSDPLAAFQQQGPDRPDAWLVDPLLAKVRQAERVDLLPLEAQQAWNRFWSETVTFVGTFAHSLKNRVDDRELIEAIQPAVAFAPSAHNLDVLGWLYLRQHRYDEAAQILQRALVIDPDNYDANAHLSMVYYEQGNLEAALAPATRAKILRPDAWSLLHHGTILYHLKRYEACLIPMRRMVKNHADDPNGWQLLAAAAAKLERWDEAGSAYEGLFQKAPRVHVRDPDNISAIMARAGTGESDQSTVAERVAWRRRSREILEMFLATEPTQAARDAVLRDARFEGVRDPALSEQLPEQERHQWEDLWRRVRQMPPPEEP